MRVPALALVLALAGCMAGDGGATRVDEALEDCRDANPVRHIYYFGPGHHLGTARPTNAGAEPGNAFSSGFLTNDLKEWRSDPVADGLWLLGDVHIEYWVRSTGMPAPLAIGGDPGEAYHFFNQFGSDRTFQPAYATEYADIAPEPGSVAHYEETLTMPPGGFVLEAGDRVRLLLTDLALDGPDGSGHEILFGGDTPSSVSFTATCFPRLSWPRHDIVLDETVLLPGNQGLLFAGIPASLGADTASQGTNYASFVIRPPPGTDRLTVQLTQLDDANPAKDDIDLVLIEPGTNNTWGMGSPYSDERGALWQANLDAVFPAGVIEVRVDSYSGAAYRGRLLVTAERAALD